MQTEYDIAADKYLAAYAAFEAAQRALDTARDVFRTETDDITTKEVVGGEYLAARDAEEETANALNAASWRALHSADTDGSAAHALLVAMGNNQRARARLKRAHLLWLAFTS